jgi:hypothetical protein
MAGGTIEQRAGTRETASRLTDDARTDSALFGLAQLLLDIARSATSGDRRAGHAAAGGDGAACCAADRELSEQGR